METGPSELVIVERAAQELRRGLPVALTGPDGAVLLALAAEFADQARLDGLAALAGGGLDLVLTHDRAGVLKLMLYTPDVVLLPVKGHVTPDVIRSLADPALDLANPLRGPFAIRRDGATRLHAAAVALAKVAMLLPAVVVAAGDAARLPADLIRVPADPVLRYDVTNALSLTLVTQAKVPLQAAENTHILAFRPRDGGTEHLAIVIGEPEKPGPVLIRIHSECFTGDLLGSLKCDCGDQLRGAIDQIAAEGAGILLYLRQEGRGIGLLNKLRAYQLQGQGFDTFEANQRLGFRDDERLFLPAAEMLRHLGYSKVRLMTNNPDKVAGLEQLGIAVVERVPHAFVANDHNAFYLSIKAKKGGHLL